jgi:hypothetical protein
VAVALSAATVPGGKGTFHQGIRWELASPIGEAYSNMRWWERLFVVTALFALMFIAVAILLLFPVH